MYCLEYLKYLSARKHYDVPLFLTAFQEVFNLFDINGGGTIDATELDAALKTVDIHLSHTEIMDVLMVIDEDGWYNTMQ